MDRNLRIRMLLEASDRVTRPLREMAGGAGKAGIALKQTRDRLKDLERAQSDIGAFRSLKMGMRSAETQAGSAQTRVAELARQIAATSSPTKKLTRDFESAKRAAAALKIQHEAETAELQRLRDRLQAAGISTNKLSAHERELRGEVARTNNQLEEQSRRLKATQDHARRFAQGRENFGKVQSAATGLAASGFSGVATGRAMAQPLIGSAKGAMDLEEGMAGVAKVTGMANAPLMSMQDRIVDLSTKIPMTAVELSNIAAAAGAAGVGMDKFGRALPTQADELVAFTGDAARMGIAFDMAAEEAGSTMAKWRQSFQMTQPEIVALGDRVNALTNKFGGSASAIAGIITRIGPLGKVAGIAAAEISALASRMNAVGVEEEVAATSIKNMLLGLTKGTAATKSQQKAFAKLGLDATKVAKAMQIDASGTIVDVLERLNGLSLDEQASTLSQLFGSESVTAIATLLTGLDRVKEGMALVGDSAEYAGSMAAEFQARINTAKGATDIAINSFQAVNIALGQALLPTIKAGAQRFSEITKRVREWAKQNPGFARGVMLVGAGLSALFIVLGGAAIAIAGALAPFAALSFAAGALGVGLLPVIGIAAAVAAGIALLAGAGYLIYKNWNGISAYFANIWGQVKTAFDGGIWGVLAMLSGWGGQVRSALWNGLAMAVSYLYANFPISWAGFKTVMWNVIWNGLLLLPRLFVQFGINTLKGFVQGLFSGLGLVKNAITNIAGSTVTWFKDKLGIKSPSRVFRGLGGHIMQGLNDGLGAGEKGPLGRITALSRNMTAALAVGGTMGIGAATAGDLQMRATTVASALQRGSTSMERSRSAAASSARAGATMASLAGKIEIHIHQLPGQSQQDLAAMVKEQLARIENDRSAGHRASMRDRADGEDL